MKEKKVTRSPAPSSGTKVSQEKRYLSNIKEEFTLVVKYKTKTSKFSIQLPQKMQERMGFRSLWGNTEDDVVREFFKVQEDYLDMLTTKKKVILYKFESRAHVMDEKDEKCIHSSNDISFCEGTGLTLEWNVYYLQELSGEKSYHDIEDGKYITWFNESDTYLEWTPEREKFFQETQEFLELLIMKAYKFFKDSKETAKLIDSQVRLLPEVKGKGSPKVKCYWDYT